MIDSTDLHELREVIYRARTILETTILPEGRAMYAQELLENALAITDNLISKTVAGEPQSRDPEA